MTERTDLKSLIIDLECALRQINLWESEAPAAEALSSTEPFCIDTLNFPQWLQFIFIERISNMLEAELPLPYNSNIAPMSEEYFRGLQLSGTAVTAILVEIDKVLSG